MAIVTISRELGSEGTRIATRLSEQLGCALLDKGSVEKQMREYGISAEMVDAYDEKKPGFWDRISSDKTRYKHFLRGSILETARAGSCVILGRGGQVVLENIPGVLHVRVTAPEDVRVERVAQRFECDREQAARLLRQSDEDRSGFHRFFFGSNWAAAEHYDLVVSTAMLSVEQVVQGIIDVTPPGLGVQRDATGQQALIDRCLEMRVLTLLIYRKGMTIPLLRVQADNGVVTLVGQVLEEGLIQEVGALVSELEDVTEVDNKLIYSLSMYPAMLRP